MGEYSEAFVAFDVAKKKHEVAHRRSLPRNLVEAAWTYRYPARVSEAPEAAARGVAERRSRHRLESANQTLHSLSSLSAVGKKPPAVVPAIAREMAAFLWAIGQEVAPLRDGMRT